MERADLNKRTIVTGASSGIGLAISEVLCQMGYQVYGFGRDFSGAEEKMARMGASFCPVTIDLLKTEDVLLKLKEIRKEGPVQLLVNNAGAAYYGPHETLKPAQISEMVRLNLEVPMILTQALLRDLKAEKGTVINISSVTAEGVNTYGCVYGATKAGLASFTKSLFEEGRKSGLKVVSIAPDMTQTRLYRNADFTVDEEVSAHLMPEDVARAVRFILEQPERMAVAQVTLRPQLHRIKRKKTADK